LGNGLHISALLLRELPAAEDLPAVSGGVGDETLACTSANQVFRQLEGGLLEHIRKAGRVLAEGLELLRGFDSVLDVRCVGLAAAVEFKTAESCGKTAAYLKERGFFVGRVENCITMKPPYVVTCEQLEVFMRTLREGLERLG